MSSAPAYIGNKSIINGLNSVLANTFVIYMKAHSFHWNVTGVHFKPLHDMFEEQYTELWQATDTLAERIRALDAFAPNSFKELLGYATLKETGQTPDADQMLGALADDHRTLAAHAHDVLEQAQKAGDEATADLLIGRINLHEKTAWMLAAHLKK